MRAKFYTKSKAFLKKICRVPQPSNKYYLSFWNVGKHKSGIDQILFHDFFASFLSDGDKIQTSGIWGKEEGGGDLGQISGEIFTGIHFEKKQSNKRPENFFPLSSLGPLPFSRIISYLFHFMHFSFPVTSCYVVFFHPSHTITYSLPFFDHTLHCNNNNNKKLGLILICVMFLLKKIKTQQPN